MGIIIDMFKSGQYKKRIDELERENADYKRQSAVTLSVQQMSAVDLDALVAAKQNQVNDLKASIAENEKQRDETIQRLASLKNTINDLQSQIVDLGDQIKMEEFGLYKPHFDFADALGYKDKLADIRQDQKKMIKANNAFTIFRALTMDGSDSKGHSVQMKNGKQLIRSFNVECEAAINKVTYGNIDRIESRIQKSFDQLNKLNDSNGVRLKRDYINLKFDELHLAFEFETKKQAEKEELREQREREREEKQAQKEMRSAQKEINKELEHYQKALLELQAKLDSVSESDRQDVQDSIAVLEQNISDASTKKNDLDYRSEHATAGYVYIISNIGSFGKDVVKIGVTRRLNPMDRIDELGSASVPFKFDVHALIFSYDAYQLESDLHHRFEDNRLNKVNMRKEYFNISIPEIEDALQEYKDLTVDFNEKAEAPEYRQSIAKSTD